MPRHRLPFTAPRRFSSCRILTVALGTAVALSVPSLAIESPGTPDDDPSVRSSVLAAEPTLEWIDAESGQIADYPGLAGFIAEHGTEWEIVIDRRSARPHLLQGSGVPLIPGPGNSLTSRELGMRGDIAAADVERELRKLLGRYPGLLSDRLDDFSLDPERSFKIGDHWSLELRQQHQGLMVENALIFARITAGNLTQLGALRVAPIEPSVQSTWSESVAFDAALSQLELAPAVASAKLSLLPTVATGEWPGMAYAGEPGTGWHHRLVWTWSFIPKRADGTLINENPLASWLLRVDAHSGEVLEFMDETRHADVKADIVPTLPNDPLVTVGVPFMEVGLTPGGTVFTDANGFYNYPGTGTLAAGRLFGRYVKAYEGCSNVPNSNIWIGNSIDGNLDFGGVPQPAPSCDYPANTAGSGNTNSVRTAYVHVSRQQNDARCRFNSCTGLAPFPLLATPFDVYSNVFILACNGAWLPGSNDLAVGPEAPGLCNNTGTNRAVLMHEWGHAFDDFTGGVAPERGSGEAFGDTFAFIETGDGCIGRDFYVNQSCANCDPSCTGVRDLPTFSIGGSRPIARPSTVERTDGLNCAPTIFDPQTGSDYIECPVSYQGPMGYEGHCESHIASTANWDLRESLRARWGAGPGATLFEDLWWETSVPARSAYRVASGGQCNPEAAIDGCAADNWYRLLLQMDDDNGNLADGTPNGCRIFDAYAAHGIACGSRPPCSADVGACVPPPSSLRAWWPLDTVTANWTTELMAQNNATLSGDPQVIGGMVGPALSFDGNDHLEVQDCQHIDVGTGDFTILSWVRTTATGGTILSKRTRTGSQYVGYHLELLGGRPIMQMADPAASFLNYYATTLPPINDGQWHLLAVSVDRNSTAGMNISVDGGAPQVFNPTSRQGNLANLSDLRLARAIGNSYDNYLIGDLDEVQIIQRALSQGEIQAIFAAGSSGVCTSPLSTLQSCSSSGSN